MKTKANRDLPLLVTPVRRFFTVIVVFCTVILISTVQAAKSPWYLIMGVVMCFALCLFTQIFLSGLKNKAANTKMFLNRILTVAENILENEYYIAFNKVSNLLWLYLDPDQELFLFETDDFPMLVRLIKNKENILKLAEKEIELSTLQSQINPHFLYNTLESIRGAALLSGASAIAEMTEKLSSIFRYSTNKAGKLVFLKEAFQIIEYYIAIQNFRFDEKIIYRNNVTDNRILSCRIPSLTIQPLVENAIFHGIEQKIGKSHIIINAELTENSLLLNIGDDGIGIKSSTLDRINRQLFNWRESDTTYQNKGHGMGIININKRLKMEYGEAYGVTLMSEVGFGTNVYVRYPIIED